MTTAPEQLDGDRRCRVVTRFCSSSCDLIQDAADAASLSGKHHICIPRRRRARGEAVVTATSAFVPSSLPSVLMTRPLVATSFRTPLMRRLYSFSSSSGKQHMMMRRLYSSSSSSSSSCERGRQPHHSSIAMWPCDKTGFLDTTGFPVQRVDAVESVTQVPSTVSFPELNKSTVRLISLSH